jgi:hypothetical protein
MNTLKNTMHLKTGLSTRIKLMRHMATHKDDVADFRVSIHKHAKVWRCSYCTSFTVVEAK